MHYRRTSSGACDGSELLSCSPPWVVISPSDACLSPQRISWPLESCNDLESCLTTVGTGAPNSFLKTCFAVPSRRQTCASVVLQLGASVTFSSTLLISNGEQVFLLTAVCRSRKRLECSIKTLVVCRGTELLACTGVLNWHRHSLRLHLAPQGRLEIVHPMPREAAGNGHWCSDCLERILVS